MVATHGEPVVITVDIGGSSIRALAWNKAGDMVALAQYETEYEISKYPGGLDFDAKKGWDLITRCTKEVLQQVPAASVKAVTAAAMREGFIIYDRDGNEIWGIPNVDARAQKEAEELLSKGYGELFFKEAGDWTSLAASARLLWLKNHEPEIWKNAAHMTMLSDWVLQRLTGRYVSDPTIGSSTTMFNLKDRTWSKVITETLGVEHLMPEVLECGSRVGEVTAKAAAETGIPEGTPVFLGGADTQMALLSGGADVAGKFGIVGGTYWLACGIVDQPMIDPAMEMRTLCTSIPGTWMVEGCGFANGLATRWVRDQLLREATEDVDEELLPLTARGYDKLVEMAMEIPPGSNGVQYFSSTVMNTREWKHPSPSLIGIDPMSGQKTGLSAISRAVLESSCYVTRGHLEKIEGVVGKPYSEVIFMGGSSRSDGWSQILCDVLGRKMTVPDVLEATCLGAALCAWTGLGEFASLSEAAAATAKPVRVYTPNPQAHEAYNEHYPKWLAMADYLTKAADMGLTNYMWVGAGARSPESVKQVD